MKNLFCLKKNFFFGWRFFLSKILFLSGKNKNIFIEKKCSFRENLICFEKIFSDWKFFFWKKYFFLGGKIFFVMTDF